MANQQLLVQLVRVKCVDETGGRFVERVGNDEIWLSAYGIDAIGRTVKVDPFNIYSNFDDGEVKEFSPQKTMLELAVPNDGPFPKTCTVGFILAERADGAGHRKATEVAFAKATEAAEQSKAHGAVLMAAAPVGAVVATVAPSIIEAVKDAVIGIVNSGLKDDVFPPQAASLEITSSDFHWPDGTKLSPETKLEFRAHQGVYYVTYYWELRTVA